MSSIEKPNDPMLDPNVKVTRTKREFAGTEDDKITKFYLDQAAQKLTPPMSEHLGSIGIYLYRNQATNSVEVVTQNQVNGVAEQIVVIGIQQAMYAMMKDYGHKLPAGVK